MCGDINMCGSTKAKITQAFDDEVYAVRCVSDVDRSADGWVESCPGIWSQSDFGSCQSLDWKAASAFCESHNGRLPTLTELRDRCTRQSGCFFDRKQSWSSTAVTTSCNNFTFCKKHEFHFLQA